MRTRQPAPRRKTIAVTVEVPPELLARLDAIAEHDMLARSALCRQLLAQAVARREQQSAEG
jgi:predicted transcriptional regulator